VSRPPGRRRGILVTSGGLAGAAVSGAVVMVAVTGGAAAPAAPAAPPVTIARVARTNLVTTVLTQGTLGYATSRPVVNQLTGTYTQLPRPGRRIGAGGTLYAVDNLPVALMSTHHRGCWPAPVMCGPRRPRPRWSAGSTRPGCR